MMFRMATPTPPPDEGQWTLLQQRLDRALWQWDRPLLKAGSGITRFVITHNPSRLDFDDFDEAENMFEMMED
jgi:hypothetical protein